MIRNNVCRSTWGKGGGMGVAHHLGWGFLFTAEKIKGSVWDNAVEIPTEGIKRQGVEGK